jgi:hypothetical protein
MDELRACLVVSKVGLASPHLASPSQESHFDQIIVGKKVDALKVVYVVVIVVFFTVTSLFVVSTLVCN